MRPRPKDRIADLNLKETPKEGAFNPEIKVISGEARLDDPTLEAKFAKARATSVEIRDQTRELPALATYFVAPEYTKQANSQDGSCTSHVAGVYCSCNKVNACSCVGHTRSSGGGSICTCVPVH